MKINDQATSIQQPTQLKDLRRGDTFKLDTCNYVLLERVTRSKQIKKIMPFVRPTLQCQTEYHVAEFNYNTIYTSIIIIEDSPLSKLHIQKTNWEVTITDDN